MGGSKVGGGSRARGIASHAPKRVFKIDCTPTAKIWQSETDDGSVLLQQFREYLAEHIKVDGRAGNLGEKVRVELRDLTLVITAYVHFSKSYFKYLTKRFLKAKQIRDHMRPVASAKVRPAALACPPWPLPPLQSSYKIQFYKIAE